MRRSQDAISVWFFPRDSTTVPADIRNGASVLNEAGWGIPQVSPGAEGDFRATE